MRNIVNDALHPFVVSKASSAPAYFIFSFFCRIDSFVDDTTLPPPPPKGASLIFVLCLAALKWGLSEVGEAQVKRCIFIYDLSCPTYRHPHTPALTLTLVLLLGIHSHPRILGRYADTHQRTPVGTYTYSLYSLTHKQTHPKSLYLFLCWHTYTSSASQDTISVSTYLSLYSIPNFLFNLEIVFGYGQCDQMARLFVQYLAIYKFEKFPK